MLHAFIFSGDATQASMADFLSRATNLQKVVGVARMFFADPGIDTDGKRSRYITLKEVNRLSRKETLGMGRSAPGSHASAVATQPRPAI